MGNSEISRFSSLTFDKFRENALDEDMSNSEKIGFPDAMRDGYEGAILVSILKNVPVLGKSGNCILDIGIGCGKLGQKIAEQSKVAGNELVAVDSEEMLAKLSSSSSILCVPGQFPSNIDEVKKAAPDKGYSAIIVYSVMQHVVLEANPFDFLDAALSLLAPGGRLLLGDIPNLSMLKRFLSSEAGEAYHKKYMQTDEPPQVDFNVMNRGKIDDSLVLGLMARGRLQGFQTWSMPQSPDLPFYQRREDLLFERP